MLQFWDKRLAQANMLMQFEGTIITGKVARPPTQSVLSNDSSGQGQSTNPIDHHVMMVKHLQTQELNDKVQPEVPDLRQY